MEEYTRGYNACNRKWRENIQDKIEELKKFIYTGENAPQDFLQYRVKAKIQALQELLESEDKK